MHWISVSEDCPKDGEEVLMIDKEGKYWLGTMATTQWYEGEYSFYISGSCYPLDITHFMRIIPPDRWR
jgi:hypothetical protein